MNDTELREHFDRWAAPLRAISAPEFRGIRWRARRRNVRLAAAIGSAAAVLAVAGVTAAVLSGAGASAVRPAVPAGWGAAHYPAPPGQPYVLMITARDQLMLRDAASGATIRAVAPGLGQFLAVAAAAGDRIFVAARQSADGQVSFTELRLSKRGRDASLAVIGPTPVLPRSVVPYGAQITSMSVNRSGTRLALSYGSAGSPAVSQAGMQVYDLTTRSLVGSWHAQEADLSSPQFLGDGDTLTVSWPLSASGARSGALAPVQLRLVSTTAAFPPGSSLLSDSRPDPHGDGGGSLSEDGSVALNTLNGEVIGITSTASGRVDDLVERSAATGRVIARTAIGPASAAEAEGSFCGVLWASSNARELLTQCGSEQLAITNGKATPVRLAWRFPVSLTQFSLPFAW